MDWTVIDVIIGSSGGERSKTVLRQKIKVLTGGVCHPKGASNVVEGKGGGQSRGG